MPYARRTMLYAPKSKKKELKPPPQKPRATESLLSLRSQVFFCLKSLLSLRSEVPSVAALSSLFCRCALKSLLSLRSEVASVPFYRSPFRSYFDKKSQIICVA